MRSLLEQLAVIVATGAVVLVPGAALVRLSGLWTSVNAYTRLPLAALVTQLLMVPVTLVALAFHIPVAPIATALVAVGGMILVALSAGPRLRDSDRTLLTEWPRLSVITVCALSSLLAFIVGGIVDGDALYHSSVATKLLELDDVGLRDLQLFERADLHPGYMLPVWHATVATAAWIAQADAPTVMFVAPAVMVPLYVLAFAGLAATAFAARGAALAGALSFVVLDALTQTSHPFWAVIVAMWPGSLALYLGVPVALACWLHATGSGRWRASLVALLLAVSAIAVLHVGSLVWLGLPIAGYLLGWLLFGLPRRINVRRHAVVGSLTALLSAAVVLAVSALTPTVGQKRGTDAVDADEFEYFDNLLTGSIDSFHLRPDYLLPAGGIAVVALLGLLVALHAPRARAGWIMWPTAALVLALSQIDWLFTALSSAVSLSQARRLGQALPLELGLAALVLVLVVAVAYSLDRRHDAEQRVICAVAAAAAVAAAFTLTALVGPLAWRLAEPTMPSLPLQLLAAAFVVATVVVVIRGYARRSRRSDRVVDSLTHADEAPAIAYAIGLAAFAIAISPLLVSAGGQLASEVQERPPPHRADALGQLERPIVDELRTHSGKSLLARPTLSLYAAAAAPVYVIAAPRAHVADTAGNRRLQRLRLVNRFFADAASSARKSAPARLDVLARENVDLLLVDDEAPQELLRLVDSTPKTFRELASGETQTLYEVRHESAPQS